MERLATADTPEGALRNVVDGWFHVLEEDVLAEGAAPDDTAALVEKTTALLENRLATVTNHAPLFGAAIRGYRQAAVSGDRATADGLLAWAAGQPHIAAAVKRTAGIKGDLDHFGALGFLQGVLTMLRDTCGTCIWYSMSSVKMSVSMKLTIFKVLANCLSANSGCTPLASRPKSVA
jgi:hypothetical protein